METSVTLPDSTTTFLSVKELEASASSQEAAQAVASLQVSTDMDQFTDLFNVTSGASATSEPHFTALIDNSVTSLKDLSMLQSTSTNPTLGTAVLTNTSSEVMVTSTTLDHQPAMLEIGNGAKSAIVSSVVNNDIYTLTLTDGSIVQLKVTNDQPTTIASQQPQITTLQNWLPASERSSASSPPVSSPVSYVEEVTLPYSTRTASTAASPELLSPESPCSVDAVSPKQVFPNIRTRKSKPNKSKKASLKQKAALDRSFSICSEEDSCTNFSGTASDTENENEDSLFSMFPCMEKVTIESLKAKLSALPEGQTDLGALLVAAKIDLTVEDIVGPPLTSVKKLMETKGLSEWQMTLCLKIRRRKKNTAAVRSSRRKRNQYVVDLRDLVHDLKRKRQEAMTQNGLLKQLTCLWERLCTEVESEIQDGVRQQLHFNIPSISDDPITDEESKMINSKINSIRLLQFKDDCANEVSTDEIMTNLFLGNVVADDVLQFETSGDDRGAMQL